MKKFGEILLKFLKITFGAAIYATGTAFFVDPHDLAPGGITGFAIVLNRAFSSIVDIPVGLFVLALNVPLLIIGLIKFGKDFLLGTVFGTIVLSLEIYFLEKLRTHLISLNQTWFIIDNPILAAIAGGAFMAVGLGIVLKTGATTGGTDIIVKLLRIKFRHLKTGRVFLIIDTIIAISSLPVVNWEVQTVLLSLLTLAVCSFLLDVVLYGPDGAKLVYIVSDKTEQIAARLLKEVDVGATYLDGVGAYTREKKEVLMCAVKKQLFPKLKDIVAQEDERAFIIVSSANEVFGEGYKEHLNEEP